MAAVAPSMSCCAGARCVHEITTVRAQNHIRSQEVE
jgi:hypothetical protein